jgi:hypothetical protein
MFGLLMSDEMWLNVTNGILGAVTLICVLAIAAAVFHDVANKVRERVRARSHFAYDRHSVALPDLGLTMADGGEPADKKQS